MTLANIEPDNNLTGDEKKIVKAKETDFIREYDNESLKDGMLNSVYNALFNLKQVDSYPKENDRYALARKILETARDCFQWMRVGDIHLILKWGSIGYFKKEPDDVNYLSVETFYKWAWKYNEMRQDVSAKTTTKELPEKDEKEERIKAKVWNFDALRNAYENNEEVGSRYIKAAIYRWLEGIGIITYSNQVKQDIYNNAEANYRLEVKESSKSENEKRNIISNLPKDSIKTVARSMALDRFLDECRQVDRELINEVIDSDEDIQKRFKKR